GVRLTKDGVPNGSECWVQREEDAVSVTLRSRAENIQRAPEWILDDRLPAGAARQHPVEPELHAGQPSVVDAGIAEHLCGDAVLRVDAPLLGVEAEPREADLLQGCRAGGIRLTLDIEEAALLPQQLGIHGVRAHAELLLGSHRHGSRIA